LTNEELEILTYNLLNLDFYANFSNFANVFEDISKEEIFHQLCEFLGIDRIENFKMESLSNLGKDNMASNILKYLLSLNFFDLKVVDTEFKKYPYTELICLLIDNSQKKFENAFGTYFNDLWIKFADRKDLNLIVEEDVNLLIQIAYQFSFKPAFTMAMNKDIICVDNLNIEAEGRMQFITLIGMGGFYDLMEKYIRQNCNTIILFDFFRNCLRGHLEANFSKESKKYKQIGSSDYELFLDILIGNPAFEMAMEIYNPMQWATKYQNKYAMLRLIRQFGLRHNFFNDLDRDTIESFLDGCVQEMKDQYDEPYIEIDYGFLRNGSFLFENSLIVLTENPESTDLITHPVIRLFVELIANEFKPFHNLNFLLFVVFYIIPAFYGFFKVNCDGFFIAFAFISIRELIQFIFTMLYNRKSQSEIKAIFYDVEADLTPKNNSKRSFRNAFYDSQINILETVLAVVMLLTGLSLHFETILLYKICLIVTILLTTVEVSFLLTSIISKQGIYWVSI
jgi:hypothetical protein